MDLGGAGVPQSLLPWSSGAQVVACHTCSSSVGQAFPEGRMNAVQGIRGWKKRLAQTCSSINPLLRSLVLRGFYSLWGWMGFVCRKSDCSVLLKITKCHGGSATVGESVLEMLFLGALPGSCIFFLLSSLLGWVPLYKLVCLY